MKLYNFFRSGTSHRLRIALNLKGVGYEYIPVNLRTEEHLGSSFKTINPQQMVPVLDTGEVLLTQSPAIIEWLEEHIPNPRLLPTNQYDRAKVRAMAAMIGCDIHPINNRRILEYLRNTLGCDETAILAWCAHWIASGFEALEAILASDAHRGDFCFGTTPSLADIYLVPQVESARRFNVDLAPYPNIVAIDQACSELDAFRRAAPGVQPDS